MIQHNFSDGLYAKRIALKAGQRVTKHTHTYSHLSIVADGCVDVIAGGSVSRFTAGDCIEITANVEHEVVAVSDAVWYCIHATHETDESRIDRVLVEKN